MTLLRAFPPRCSATGAAAKVVLTLLPSAHPKPASSVHTQQPLRYSSRRLRACWLTHACIRCRRCLIDNSWSGQLLDAACTRAAQPSWLAAPGMRCHSAKGGRVVWDEENLRENAEIQKQYSAVRIAEPKTPYRAPLEADEDHEELAEDMKPLDLDDGLWQLAAKLALA